MRGIRLLNGNRNPVLRSTSEDELPVPPADVGIDPKIRADQLGHGVDVDINEYTQVPIEKKLAAVKAIEEPIEGNRADGVTR